jgi:hypothetical protein
VEKTIEPVQIKLGLEGKLYLYLLKGKYNRGFLEIFGKRLYFKLSAPFKIGLDIVSIK